MAGALVGTIGAASMGAAGAALTPAWGTSENRTAGNLLICFVAVTEVATIPSTPAGWIAAETGSGTSCAAAIFFKVATGADAAPTITAITSGVISGQLAEYSGVSAIDKWGSGSSTTSPVVATNYNNDALPGDLVVSAVGLIFSKGEAPTITTSFTNGATANQTDNGGSRVVDHYAFVYGFTTSNPGGDSQSTSFSATAITGAVNVIASFKKPTNGFLGFF